MTPWAASANRAMKRWKQARNCSGSSRRNKRLNVSWLGAPCFRSRKPAQEVDLGLGELRHVGAALTAGQHRAEGDDQHLQQVVAGGIARARIVQLRKAGGKSLHGSPLGSFDSRVESIRSRAASLAQRMSSLIPNAIPLRAYLLRVDSSEFRNAICSGIFAFGDPVAYLAMVGCHLSRKCVCGLFDPSPDRRHGGSAVVLSQPPSSDAELWLHDQQHWILSDF